MNRTVKEIVSAVSIIACPVAFGIAASGGGPLLTGIAILSGFAAAVVISMAMNG